MTSAGAAFVYRGRQWVVWASGHVASIGGGLCIQCDTLADKAFVSGSGAAYYTWPEVISREPGVDLNDFMGAFMYALGKFHPRASLEAAMLGWIIAMNNQVEVIKRKSADVWRRYEKGEFVLGREYREPSVEVIERAPADSAEIDALANTKRSTMLTRNPDRPVSERVIGSPEPDMHFSHGASCQSAVRAPA